jgi:hypothetical protein
MEVIQEKREDNHVKIDTALSAIQKKMEADQEQIRSNIKADQE